MHENIDFHDLYTSIPLCLYFSLFLYDDDDDDVFITIAPVHWLQQIMQAQITCKKQEDREVDLEKLNGA